MSRPLSILLFLVSVPVMAAEEPSMEGPFAAVVVGETISPEALLALAREELSSEEPGIAEADLRFDNVRHGLAASHYHYVQWIDNRPVWGGELVLSVGRDCRILSRAVSLAVLPPGPAPRDQTEALRRFHPEGREARVVEETRSYRNRSGIARPVDRFVIEDAPLRFTTWEIDSVTGDLLSVIPSYASVTGRVFPANPVTVLNDPSLRDHGDDGSVIPEEAYHLVDLDHLVSSDELTGDHVRIVDIDPPFTARAKPQVGLIFGRDRDEFEEVNAYYHLDRSQRYLGLLGYTGERRIVSEGVRVDVHANRGSDNSFFSRTGQGPTILFGDGGVDDAEDPDIVLHEYGHAIHDSLSPAVLFGSFNSEGRAISEGFGDYWAFSTGFAASVAGGRDPYCIGDWDARCDGDECSYPAGSDCLRRVDLDLTIDDFLFLNRSGTEHQNGRIWSTWLRGLFLSLTERHGFEAGKRRADVLVLEGLFGLPSQPRFERVVANMIRTDRILFGSEDLGTICAGARARKFTVPDECRAASRGETLVLAGSDGGTILPGGTIERHLLLGSSQTIRRVMVKIDLDTVSMEAIRLTLRAPDGTLVVLKELGSSMPASVIFGRDRVPAAALESFGGRPNPGTWILSVEVSAEGGLTNVRHCALLLEMEGPAPIDVREPVQGSRFVPAIAHTPGAENTFFVTDLVIANPGTAREATLLFTPSGKDGRSEFRAVRVALPAGGSIVLDDLTWALFDTEGSGSLEIRDAGVDVRVSSRTYNRTLSGTFGQTIPLVREVAGPGERLLLSQVRRNALFRTNLGLVETSGMPGEAAVTVWSGAGASVGSLKVPLEPFTHRQIALTSFVSALEIEQGWVEIEVTSESGEVAAYASIVDNRTGDSVLVPGASESFDRRTLALAAAHVPGARQTKWRTDLSIVNGSEENEEIMLRFRRTDGSLFSRPLTLEPRSSRLLEDVVGEWFETEGSGWIELDESRLVVSSRTWNDDPDGSYGQFIGPISQEEALTVGASAVVPQVIVNDRFRTNVGLTEISGAPANVRVDVMDAAGTVRCSMPMALAPHQHRQIPVSPEGCGPIAAGWIAFHHLFGEGRVVAYGSIIDQQTGDPSYIRAE